MRLQQTLTLSLIPDISLRITDGQWSGTKCKRAATLPFRNFLKHITTFLDKYSTIPTGESLGGGYPTEGYPIEEYPVKRYPTGRYPIRGYPIGERGVSYRRGAHRRLSYRRVEGIP